MRLCWWMQRRGKTDRCRRLTLRKFRFFTGHRPVRTVLPIRSLRQIGRIGTALTGVGSEWRPAFIAVLRTLKVFCFAAVAGNHLGRRVGSLLSLDIGWPLT